MARLLALTLLLLASNAGASAQSVLDTPLPAPPSRFTWRILREIKAAFLVPDGWHFKEEAAQGTRAYFITEQDIARNGRFTTGLSLNVVKGVPSRAGVSAPEYARAFALQLVDTPGQETLDTWQGVQGPVHTYGVRSRSRAEDGSHVILHHVLMGNERTGTFYLLLFEAPEAQWEVAWQKGEPMLQRYAFDLSE